MLQINLSEAEIQRLNYERYYYPCPMVQKRIHAVYMKATTELSQTMIGQLTSLHRNAVRHLIKTFEVKGLEGLCQVHYGTDESELENHSESLLNSFAEHPPMNSCEAKSRIEKLTGISRSP